MQHLDDSRHLRHHAFVIPAEAEAGIEVAEVWVEKELGIKMKTNPDVIVLRYGLFSPDDARRVTELAAQAPFRGEHKVLIIAATRAYHEAQNALLKLFEEPSPGTHLFFVLPSLGGLLPTLRSRVQILKGAPTPYGVGVPTVSVGKEFLKATKEKRSAIIKKLTGGRDEEERRELRDEAVTLANGIEAALLRQGLEGQAATLREISILRAYLYDRSAPVKMILEHLSLVVPKGLL